MTKHWPSVLLAAISLILTGCGGGSDSGSPKKKTGSTTVKVTAAHREEANTLFTSLCVTCHGTTGIGDGPGAAAMDPKPRSFSDPAWQASVDDAHLRKVITLGGAAVGKSPMMPPQPQLKGKQAVLQALVEKIRAFRAD